MDNANVLDSLGEHARRAYEKAIRFQKVFDQLQARSDANSLSILAEGLKIIAELLNETQQDWEATAAALEEVKDLPFEIANDLKQIATVLANIVRVFFRADPFLIALVLTEADRGARMQAIKGLSPAKFNEWLTDFLLVAENHQQGNEDNG